MRVAGLGEEADSLATTKAGAIHFSLWSEGRPSILVVMSYEQDNPWVKEIREGIDSVFGLSSEITYFYMDTKVNRDGGSKRKHQWLI